MTEFHSSNKYWHLSTPTWALIAVAVMLVGFSFFEAVHSMISKWSNQEEYGYGYLIPVITAFLIWQRKNQLAAMEFRSSWWGLALIFVGGILFFLGAIATVHTVSQYALIVTIMGIALAFMGWPAFKIVAVPLALLLFMVPFPAFIYNNLSSELQLLSSKLGVAVIRLFGISVYLEGNVIDLGVYKLQVVEACSGLRYLFPLVSLAFVMTYLYQVELWKRAVVFLSSIPVTVLMNSFRIGVIGVLVEYGGTEQAEGFLHYFEGWVIFMACMAILLVEMALLAKIGKSKQRLSDVFAIDFPESLPKDIQSEPRTLSVQGYGIIVMLVFIAASSLYASGRNEVNLNRQSFSGFPMTIGGWQGTPDRLERNIADAVRADDYIIVDYAKENKDRVNFYVAYYKSQQAGASAHSPRACIPGGGWLIKDLSTRQIDNLVLNGKMLEVNRLVIKKGDYTQVVYYWFQQRGRVITNEYLVKWYLFWDALTQNRTDGALVRLTVLLGPGEDAEDGDKQIGDFAREVHPYLDKYIPG